MGDRHAVMLRRPDLQQSKGAFALHRERRGHSRPVTRSGEDRRATPIPLRRSQLR
jgi:hypothetical protein